MAKLQNLATELVLAITSFIPRSADKLHLALVNSRMHHIIIPEIYKSVVLDQSGDRTRRYGESSRNFKELCWDTRRLCLLNSVLEHKPPSHQSVVESLRLELDSNTMYESLWISRILQHVPYLKSLCLRGKRPVGHDWDQVQISPLLLGRSLRTVHGTLESLVIDIGQDIHFRERRRFGTFGTFTALKHLGIQSHIFFGERYAHLLHTEIDGTGDQIDMSALTSFLPPRLQKLEMGCWTDGELENKPYWRRLIAAQLEFLMEWGLGYTLRELQEITVYDPVTDCGPHDLTIDLALEEEEQDLASNKSECVRYAAEGRWQELAKKLMEMASRAHQNIFVKFEQTP